MEILKEGKANVKNRITTICDHCGSKIRFWATEPMVDVDKIISSEPAAWIVDYGCPVCGKHEKQRMIAFNGVIGVEENVVMTLKEKEDYDKLFD